MAPPVEAANVDAAFLIAADVARGFGLNVGQPMPLRSTNNAVAWLQPADVVAKVSVERNSRLGTELQVARQLCALGAPVVCPAPELPAVVHNRSGLEMTFWRYYVQPSAGEPSPERLALALTQLHAALGQFAPGLKSTLPSYMEELDYVRSLLVHHAAVPALSTADRELLLNTFDKLHARLERTATLDRFIVLHGSPHSYNVLLTPAGPAFIDFETVCMGPLEWDLAHVTSEVEPFFGDRIRADLLWSCRSMASVKAATLCWADVARGDMREHAEGHLAHIKEEIAPSVR